MNDLEQSVAYIELAISDLNPEQLFELETYFRGLLEMYDRDVLPFHESLLSVSWAMALIWGWNHFELPTDVSSAISMVSIAIGDVQVGAVTN